MDEQPQPFLTKAFSSTTYFSKFPGTNFDIGGPYTILQVVGGFGVFAIGIQLPLPNVNSVEQAIVSLIAAGATVFALRFSEDSVGVAAWKLWGYLNLMRRGQATKLILTEEAASLPPQEEAAIQPSSSPLFRQTPSSTAMATTRLTPAGILLAPFLIIGRLFSSPQPCGVNGCHNKGTVLVQVPSKGGSQQAKVCRQHSLRRLRLVPTH